MSIVNREEAVLREFNLYPLWQRRVQVTPAESVAFAQPIGVDIIAPVVADTPNVLQPATPKIEVIDLKWPELKTRVRDCTECRLRAGCTQTVFGVGDEKARWLFVGEGAGAEEDAQGEPFVGQAGKLLDNMLMAIKLKRGKEVYITNVVKCHPPDNRTPHKDEIAACMPYLQQQIKLLQPKIIVALGKVAATALLGKEATLVSLRERVHYYQDIPLIITYHPAYLLRSPADKALAWQDLCLAVTTMEG
jgi:DNA polymerase